MHNFNPDGGGSTGWRDFSAFLLFQKSGKTFLRCRKPTARMKGMDQLFTHTFPSLWAWRAGNVTAAVELSAILL